MRPGPGGPGGIRTPDLPLRRRLLCPLSYGPISEAGVKLHPGHLERETGLEPATLGLEGRCSTNLSYSRVVGAARFERATPCSQSRCATGLRYAPGPKATPEATITLDPKRVKACYNGPMRLGPVEILLILLVILLLFGAKKLPELARGIGQSAREFKKGLQEGEEKKEEPKA